MQEKQTSMILSGSTVAGRLAVLNPKDCILLIGEGDFSKIIIFKLTIQQLIVGLKIKMIPLLMVVIRHN